jgi:putative transcription factor
MFCEICGEAKATARVKLDGIIFDVCEECTRFGNRLAEREVVKREAALPEEREDIVPDYAERIRKAREGRGMSLEELAGAILVKRSALAKVESGKMLPDSKLVKKLEKFLGISVRGVVDGGTSKTTKHPAATLGDLAVVKKR